jgi:hypothetical protein
MVSAMKIELHLSEQWPAIVNTLRATLGSDVAIRVWPGDEMHLTTVYIDVLTADTQSEALERIQPAVWLADPDGRLIVGGTTTSQLIVPKPPLKHHPSAA